jgi:hypothetical protein
VNVPAWSPAFSAVGTSYPFSSDDSLPPGDERSLTCSQMAAFGVESMKDERPNLGALPIVRLDRRDRQLPSIPDVHQKWSQRPALGRKPPGSSAAGTTNFG